MRLDTGEKRGLADRLRKLGGNWEAHRTGFASYAYSGRYGGSKWTVRAYSQLAPQHPADDDTFVTVWVVDRDGIQVAETQGCPAALIRRIHPEPKNKDKDK